MQKLKENSDLFREKREKKLEENKMQENSRESSNEWWKEFKEILYKIAVESFGLKSHNRIKNPRITEDMVNKIE